MKNFFSIFIFSLFILGGLLLSCKSKAFPEETKETIIHKTETVKDTILVVEKDSSYYEAYIDCVNGKPVLITDENNGRYQTQSKQEKHPKSQPGKYLDVPKVNLQNGLLTVNCEKRAQDLFFTWKETFVREWQINHKPIYKDKELATFQKVKLFIGNVVFWALCLAIILFSIRFLISKKSF
jgi:hypothetical protein